MVNRRRITAALVGLLVLVLGGWLVKENIGDSSSSAPSKPSTSASAGASSASGVAAKLPGSDSGLPVKPLSGLPSQARDTWKLIEAGGPYPYPRNDNVVFENREKVLPRKQSGYYHEYTVTTPKSPDRGPRRLVTGQAKELFYTDDHYASFVVVDPNR
ncbi:ribonuclease domain-containing protein [Amycolatopsis rhabdoformis]|uniref:Ribonuclease domain-containing protein n=1 Tax=Amycolatopsis rhabdoformis TaxID=1448059 RepID=A0ABZ1IK24_9PSEU|nr:ribonuclease domain-containing protein [Amycolatopsis rhabdoformis]WSE34860.1 ribonuclease domain-containing protein [Amycolatopsis rhabdoformis]